MTIGKDKNASGRDPKRHRGTISRSGDNWEVRYRLNGRRYSHTVRGSYQDAQKWLTSELKAQDDHWAVAPSKLTTQQFLEARWFRDVHHTRSISMQRIYADSVRRMVRQIGTVTLQDLTPTHIGEARDKELDRGLAAKTVANDLTCLRTALEWAVKMRYVPENVAKVVDLPAIQRKPINPFTMDEAESLLQEFWAHQRSDSNMLAVGLLLGVRTYSELGGVRTRDLDVPTGQLSLEQVLLKDVVGRPLLAPAGNSKHKRRLLRLPRRAMPFIERQVGWLELQYKDFGLGWNPHRLLFPNPLGLPIRYSTMRRFLQRIVNEIGVEWRAPHALRHTTASILLAGGAHMKVVQEVLAHSTYKLTADTYAHLVPGATAHALDEAWGIPPHEANELLFGSLGERLGEIAPNRA